TASEGLSVGHRSPWRSGIRNLIPVLKRLGCLCRFRIRHEGCVVQPLQPASGTVARRPRPRGSITGRITDANWCDINLPRPVFPRRILVMIGQSTITCPKCGYAATEQMPTDACQFFYDCKGYGDRLKPKPGDCCVFCSYGSVPCPSM